MLVLLTPFTLAGMVIVWLGIHQITERLRTNDWVQSPAWIDRVDLIADHSGEGTTYRTEAEYHYQWKQQEYKGNRVWLGKQSDSGSFHQRISDELKSYQQRQVPFRCFVNPANPAESILYRDLRLDLLLVYGLFGLVFGGTGCGGLYGLYVSHRRTKQMWLQSEQFPTEPWRWATPASSGCFREDNRWLVILIVASIWNLFSWPFLFLVLNGNRWEIGVVWLTLLFPVAGIWIGWKACRAVQRRLRCGVCTLQIRPWPLFAGDSLQALLRIHGMIPASGDLKVELRVAESVSGDESDRELFRETTQVPITGREVSFSLHPPDHLLRTRRLIDHHTTRTAKWTVVAIGSEGSHDFDARFQLEVFDAAERPDGRGSAEVV